MLHEKSFQTNNNNHQVRQWCGIQNGKKLIGLCEEIIFMINDIIFLNIEWRTPYPLTNVEDPFGLRASVSFLDSINVLFPVHLDTGKLPTSNGQLAELIVHIIPLE